MEKDISIISDNCWGTGVYKKNNWIFNTPFINLYIHTPCFIKLVKNFKKYMEMDLKKIDYYESKYFTTNVNYPMIVTTLEDIEICFTHTVEDNTNFDKIKEIWKRRLDRLNWNNLLFKCGGISEKNFQMYDNILDSLIEEFHNIPDIKKVSFTIKKYKILDNYIIKNKHLKNPYKLGLDYKEYLGG